MPPVPLPGTVIAEIYPGYQEEMVYGDGHLRH